LPDLHSQWPENPFKDPVFHGYHYITDALGQGIMNMTRVITADCTFVLRLLVKIYNFSSNTLCLECIRVKIILPVPVELSKLKTVIQTYLTFYNCFKMRTSPSKNLNIPVLYGT